MKDIILIIDILSAIGIVGLVLLQQGKGADIGAAFGSGASQTLFGSRGSANFLTRATAMLAVVFFGANLALAWLATHEPARSSVTQSVTTDKPATQPTESHAPPPTPAVPEVPR